MNADNFSPSVQITDNEFDHDGTGVSVGVGSNTTNVTSITNNTFGVNVDTTFNFSNLTTPVTFNAEATNNVLSNTAAATPNTDIYILGGSGGNNLTGTNGNDILIGGAGNDTFNLGTGNNSVTGGGGIDTVNVGAGYHIVIESGQWVVTNGIATDTLSGIDKVDINGTNYELVDNFGVANGGFQSLQAAIDNAAANTTILVAPGTYTESANYNPNNNTDDPNFTNPVGLLVNKSGLTIEGVDANGNPITSASDTQATIVSSIESDWGTNFYITAPNVTMSGLAFQATDLEYGQNPENTGIVNKAIEDIANNFTLEDSLVGAINGVPLGSSVYIDDPNATTSPSFVSSINQYNVTNNILDGDFVEASGVGFNDPSGSLSLNLTNNEFSLNAGTTLADYVNELGGANLGVILEGGLYPTVGWDLAPVADPTVTGNTIDANYTESPSGARFLAWDNSAANLPSVSYIQNYVTNNNLGTYAYDLTSGGALDIQPDSGTSYYYVYIDAGDASGGATAGDTMIVQSGSDSSVQTITTNNLTIDALSGSSALDLALGGGVTTITFADYSSGAGARVTVIGNNSGDTITGNDGNDALTGGSGNDTFNLGSGNNAVTGAGGTRYRAFLLDADRGKFHLQQQ